MGLSGLSTKDPAERERDSGFRKELEQLINRHSVENGSDTPDFILADYLVRALIAFERANNEREKWYGKINVPGQASEAPATVAAVEAAREECAKVICGSCGGGIPLNLGDGKHIGGLHCYAWAIRDLNLSGALAEVIRQNREDEALWWQKMYIAPHGGPCSCVPCVRVAGLRKKTDKGGK